MPAVQTLPHQVRVRVLPISRKRPLRNASSGSPYLLSQPRRQGTLARTIQTFNNYESSHTDSLTDPNLPNLVKPPQQA
jgi:hypothetical protein